LFINMLASAALLLVLPAQSSASLITVPEIASVSASDGAGQHSAHAAPSPIADASAKSLSGVIFAIDPMMLDDLSLTTTGFGGDMNSPLSPPVFSLIPIGGGLYLDMSSLLVSGQQSSGTWSHKRKDKLATGSRHVYYALRGVGIGRFGRFHESNFDRGVQVQSVPDTGTIAGFVIGIGSILAARKWADTVRAKTRPRNVLTA